MPENMHIRTASEDDIPRVLALLNAAFSGIQRSAGYVRDNAFWNWKYRSSPFGESQVHVITIDENVVAAGAMWRMKLLAKGNELDCFQLCDTAVDEKFRGRGLFKTLDIARVDFATRQQADLIFNFPNANSLPGHLKQGAKFLGKVPWLINIRRPLQLIINRRYKSSVTPAPIPKDSRLSSEIAQKLDGECKQNEGDAVSLYRPPGYWRWRYCEHPSRDYGILRLGGRARGFCIFTLNSTSRGMTEMVIVDFCLSTGDFSDLLSSVQVLAKSLGVAFTAMMKPHSGSVLNAARFGFFPVKSKNLVCRALSERGQEAMESISNWDLQAALHDSI